MSKKKIVILIILMIVFSWVVLFFWPKDIYQYAVGSGGALFIVHYNRCIGLLTDKHEKAVGRGGILLEFMKIKITDGLCYGWMYNKNILYSDLIPFEYYSTLIGEPYLKVDTEIYRKIEDQCEDRFYEKSSPYEEISKQKYKDCVKNEILKLYTNFRESEK